MRIVDLSRELYHRTPSYPGQPPIIHGIWKTHEEAFADSGNIQGNSVMFFSMPDHGGTHIDAPRHFGKSGTPIDKYPLENCIVQGICIDLRHIAPRAEITPADLEAAVKKAGVERVQYQLMLAIKGMPKGVRPRIRELASRMEIRHHSAVELVNRLEARGFVHRTRANDDRREVLLALTPKGQKVLAELASPEITTRRILT